MKRAFSIVATVAALTVATAAAAKEHTVLVLPDAYFPQVTYLNPGDSIRFVNMSGEEHNVVGKDNTWELGPIPDQGEATVDVSPLQEKIFFDKDAVNANGELFVQGEISFEQAPLD